VKPLKGKRLELAVRLWQSASRVLARCARQRKRRVWRVWCVRCVLVAGAGQHRFCVRGTGGGKVSSLGRSYSPPSTPRGGPRVSQYNFGGKDSGSTLSFHCVQWWRCVGSRLYHSCASDADEMASNDPSWNTDQGV